MTGKDTRTSEFWHLIRSGILKFDILKGILLILFAAFALYYSWAEASCKGSLHNCSPLERSHT